MWIFNADKSIQMYANQFSCIMMFKYSWIVQTALLVDKCWFIFHKSFKNDYFSTFQKFF